MRRAEVVDRSQKVEARFEGCPGASQMPRSPREHGEPLSEGRVQPFDVAGRDHPAADLTPEPDEPIPRAARQMNEPSGLYVSDKNKLQAGQKARSSWAAGPECKAESLLEGLLVATKAVDHNQKRPGQRRAANHLGQRASRLLAALRRDQAPEPQPRCDADRREEIQPPAAPAEASLRRRTLRLGPDEDLVGLNVAEYLRTENKRLVDLSAVGSGLEKPTPDRPALNAEGGGDRRKRAAVSDQRDDRHNQARIGLRVEEGRAGPLGEGLPAFGAPVSFSSAAVDLDVASGSMPPSYAVRVRTEGRKRVHVSKGFVGSQT